MNPLVFAIVVPAVAAIAGLLTMRMRGVREAVLIVGAACNLAIGYLIWSTPKQVFTIAQDRAMFDAVGLHTAWFSLQVDALSSFMLFAASIFGLLVAIYSAMFMWNKERAGWLHFFFLLILAMSNGALLANNLFLMLFFWEGMAVALFGSVFIGGTKTSQASAIKVLIIGGTADLLLLLGISLTWVSTGTLNISDISALHLVPAGVGIAAFLLMMAGATAKAGSMPFHSWIPDAASDAPLPFMALVPGAMEKLLGIYLVFRVSVNMFHVQSGGYLSILMMTLGAITILLAVVGALAQKDYKRLLAYHAISQVGYMILGIGTGLAAGIVGGLFHMLNNAMYKSCLFLTGGAVERETGTTDLNRLGGIGRAMPVTFVSFILAACAISGVPFFNGFYSKELIYDAAKAVHPIFYVAAILGSFLTAASFLKLGHAAFLGPKRDDTIKPKEAPIAMLAPMVLLAISCLFFGVYNQIPIDGALVQTLPEMPAAGEHLSGFPENLTIVFGSVGILMFAVLIHSISARIGGSGLKGSDLVLHSPVLEPLYHTTVERTLDPYRLFGAVNTVTSRALFAVDKGVDWLIMASGRATVWVSTTIRKAHTGDYGTYLLWSIVGAILAIAFLLRTL